MFKNKIASNSRHRGYLVFNFFFGTHLHGFILRIESRGERYIYKKKKHVKLAWVSKFSGSKTPRALFMKDI